MSYEKYSSRDANKGWGNAIALEKNKAPLQTELHTTSTQEHTCTGKVAIIAHA